MDHQSPIRPGTPVPIDRLKAAALSQAQLAREQTLDSKPAAAFVAPGSEHVAAVQSAHPTPEAMDAFPPAVVWLKGSLHSLTSPEPVNYSMRLGKGQGRREPSQGHFITLRGWPAGLP